MPYLLAVFFYFFWNIVSNKVTEAGMWLDIFSKFHAAYWRGYIQQIIVFPVEVFCRFLPVSGLAVYYIFRKKILKIKFNPYLIQILMGITLLNFIPYWLAPHTSIRYLLPLYPFIALLLAMLLWHLSSK